MKNATVSPSSALLRGAMRAGVDACVYLPDSCLTSTIRMFQTQSAIKMIPCAREDEGVAIAVGLNLGGRTAICLMEASGIGYSGLILARAHVQRTPVVIVASHSGGGGEPFDYHGATTLVAERIFAGLGLSYEVANDVTDLESMLYRTIQTAQGQLTSRALLLPPFVMVEATT